MTHHVEPVKTYVAVFGTLMVLTVLTVLASRVDLGPLNVIVALAIAVAKMLVVILFFMHVRHSSKLTKVVVVSGFFWLGILLALTLNDYLSRDWLPSPEGW